jgi:hypothetical protein
MTWDGGLPSPVQATAIGDRLLAALRAEVDACDHVGYNTMLVIRPALLKTK